MSTREKEVLRRVINLYRSMDFLWDKKHKDYTVRRRRDEGYQALLEIFKEIDEYATPKSMVKKLQNLRTNYIKEHKKVLRKMQEGEDYVPTLWYYDDLSFLEANGETYSYHSTTSDPLDAEDASVSSLSDTENEQATTSQAANISARKRKRFTQPSVLRKQNSVDPEAEEYSHIKNYEWEVLGKAIGFQLRELKKKQLTITQKLISDAIYYGRLGLLSENSFVAVEPARHIIQNPEQPIATQFVQELHEGDLKKSPTPGSPSSSYYDNAGNEPPSPSYC